MLDAGVKVSGGSDSPVTDFNTMKNIYTAVTRKNLVGDKVLNKDQALDLETAIRLFTVMGAYPSFDENKKGTLEIGKYADIVVLERDPFEVDVEELKSINVAMTITDGRIVYTA